MAKIDLPTKDTSDMTKQYFDVTDKVPAEIWYWAALTSILASASLFFVNKRDWGLFIGQWPPTFLLFALFHKILKLSR